MELIINTDDIARYNRQLEAVDKWYKNSGRGIAKIVPRFGKTNMCIIAIDKMIKSNPNIKCLIIVPNQDIADGWSKYFKDIDFRINIITIYNYKLYSNFYNAQFYNLIVIDEGQKYLQADTLKLFNDLKFRFSIVNMGVINNTIDIRGISNIFGGIFDEITETYSIKEGFTSNYEEHNLLIDLDESVKSEYAKYSIYISECSSLFKNALMPFNYNGVPIINNVNELLLGCLYGIKKSIFYKGNYKSFEYTYGQVINTISAAMGYSRDLSDDTDYNRDRIKYWNHNAIYENAKKYKNYVDLRNKIHDNLDDKIYPIISILHKVQKPTIIFTNSIEMCHKVTGVINAVFNTEYDGGVAVAFNSQYKTDKYFSRTKGDYVRNKNGNVKNVGRDLYRRLIKEDIDNGFYKVLVVVKSFNEGVTFSNIKCAIITSSSINSIDDSQKKARIKNKSDLDDIAIVYNLAINHFTLLDYDINSRDLTKLEIRQNTNKINTISNYKNDLNDLINSNIKQAIIQYNASLFNV